MEQYLYLIKYPTIRRTFTQFRISNHKLQIERGRYENVPREKRIFKLCTSVTEVENEFHLVFTCQKYDNIRNNSNNILKDRFNRKKSYWNTQCPPTIQFLLTYYPKSKFMSQFTLLKGKLASNPRLGS